jgi:hypothetical protein
MTELPMADWPKIPGAKGIVWRIQRGRKECRWQARPDIVKRGWKIKTHLLWQGASDAEPDDFQKSFIADRSSSLQSDMLFFARGQEQQAKPIRDGSLAALCEAFLNDRHSPAPQEAIRHEGPLPHGRQHPLPRPWRHAGVRAERPRRDRLSRTLSVGGQGHDGVNRDRLPADGRELRLRDPGGRALRPPLRERAKQDQSPGREATHRRS